MKEDTGKKMRTIIASAIRRLRNDHDMNQSQLAGAVGINQSTLSRIENEEVDAKLSILDKMIEHFGITPIELVIRGLPIDVKVPPGVEGLSGHPPGDLAAGHRQAEVVAHLAGERRRLVEAHRRFRVEHLDLEGRPLVLLHPHRRRAAERAADVPAAEEAAAGDVELARRRAEVVGRRRG